MYGNQRFELDSEARTVQTHFAPSDPSVAVVGYQIFDPETSTFILEGEWTRVVEGQVDLRVDLPGERGRYHVYLSPIDEAKGWFYQQNKPFILIEAQVENGRAQLIEAGSTTLSALRRRNLLSRLTKTLTLPVLSVAANKSLIWSMVKRDVAARYRGSFGDVLWTVINPLLLMSTYFFVFGVVLQSRFGSDNSRTGFVLYLLAGMLPWLPFSEAVGRSPYVLLEHRNFIKKLVFPVEILPITQVVAGLVTEAFALAVFIPALFIIRGSLPQNALLLPLLLVPQMLFTAGACWFLAALGVFMRDLGQMIGFILTLWFFLTPICYPEASLPADAAWILSKNPIYVLVRGYRAIFLENSFPAWHSLWKLWVTAVVVFIAGHGWFYKLRKSFADVI